MTREQARALWEEGYSMAQIGAMRGVTGAAIYAQIGPVGKRKKPPKAKKPHLRGCRALALLCKVPDCDDRAKQRGFCRRHYSLWLYHAGTGRREKAAANAKRYLSKLKRQPEKWAAFREKQRKYARDYARRNRAARTPA